MRVAPEFAGRVPWSFGDWLSVDGDLVAASRSSETRRIRLGALTIHRKVHSYTFRGALRGALRNTLLSPSRAAAEFRMLVRLRERAGPESAPAPVAYGERRRLGLLRTAFLATLTAPGSASLQAAAPLSPASARQLGSFLARIHDAGFVHGRLFARNVLAVPSDGYRLVDLDRSRFVSPNRRKARAKDLAFLVESLPGATQTVEDAFLEGYASSSVKGPPPAAWRSLMPPHRAEARRRLLHRRPSPGTPSAQQ